MHPLELIRTILKHHRQYLCLVIKFNPFLITLGTNTHPLELIFVIVKVCFYQSLT